jgi:hypothetical protein
MILDFIKDIFSSPDSAFKKLTPEYFIQQRMKMPTQDEYAKWLLKQATYYMTMAHMEKESRGSVPQSWIDGLRLIDSEREKISHEFKK